MKSQSVSVLMLGAAILEVAFYTLYLCTILNDCGIVMFQLLHTAILYNNSRILAEWMRRYDCDKALHERTDTVSIQTQLPVTRGCQRMSWQVHGTYHSVTAVELAVRLDRLSIVQLFYPLYRPDMLQSLPTVFHLICKYAAHKCFSWAIDACYESDTIHDSCAWMPLHYAANNASADMVRSLLGKMRHESTHIGSDQVPIRKAIEVTLSGVFNFSAPETFQMGSVIIQLYQLLDGQSTVDIHQSTRHLFQLLAEMVRVNLLRALTLEAVSSHSFAIFMEAVKETVIILANITQTDLQCPSLEKAVERLLAVLYRSDLAFKQPLSSVWKVQYAVIDSYLGMLKYIMDICHRQRATHTQLYPCMLHQGANRMAEIIMYAMECQCSSDDVMFEYHGEEDYFTTGEPIYLAEAHFYEQMLAMFMDSLLHNAKLTGEFRKYLFHYLETKCESFIPFLQLYLNVLPHTEWFDAIDQLSDFVRDSKKFSVAEKQVLLTFCNPRCLKTLSRICIQTSLRQRNSFDQSISCLLPLPASLQQYVFSLNT